MSDDDKNEQTNNSSSLIEQELKKSVTNDLLSSGTSYLTSFLQSFFPYIAEDPNKENKVIDKLTTHNKDFNDKLKERRVAITAGIEDKIRSTIIGGYDKQNGDKNNSITENDVEIPEENLINFDVIIKWLTELIKEVISSIQKIIAILDKEVDSVNKSWSHKEDLRKNNVKPGHTITS
jgi:hypothetical protein